MPFVKRIAEIERAIDVTMAEIARLRVEEAEGKISRKVTKPRIEKLLGALAKLKAEKLRVGIRQANSYTTR